MKTICRRFFSIPFLFFVAIAPAVADVNVNSWTKPTSGSWEEQTYWSLGALPDSTQSVMLTNAGWKALAIGPNTAQNFPQSMQIQDLQIASPVDSYNVLLMNFSGFQVPLTTTSLTVGSNSAVVLQSSSLETGFIFLAGTINQGDFSQVKDNGAMFIRNRTQYASDVAPPGAYFLTNGALSVAGGVNLGDFSGRGQFVQYGGDNNIGGFQYEDAYGRKFASLYVGLQGEYDMYGGQLNPTNGIMVGSGDYAGEASFYQYGGSVNADLVINGNYIMNGGNITGHMQVVAQNSYQRVNATLLQTGGTNHAISLDLGYPNRFGGAAYYTLSNGVIQADSAVSFNGGHFWQYNGQFTTVSNFVMHGGTGSLDPSADYLLAGGTLSAAGLAVQSKADFYQTGGTNAIAGALVIGPIPPWQYSQYTLSGGTLNVQDIQIGANAFFQHTSGNIGQSGALTLTQGEWRAANGDYALGQLALGAPEPNVIGYHTNSAIIFPNGSSTLRLANSSAQAWAANAILYITNWNGSTSGGGATRLYFGSNSSGLTTAQLSQTTFSNPGGLPAGNYGAKILSTGEVVPDTGGGGGGDAIVNNWSNPSSGRWDVASNWSLGIVPASNQTVNITHAGYKAVNIDAATVSGFPGSMTVSNLAVAAPTDSFSTLLLNYAGLDRPLKVLNNCVIGTNGTIANYFSSFEVDGGLHVEAPAGEVPSGGSFTQVGGLTVVNGPFFLRSGICNATNGNLTLGEVTIGEPQNFDFGYFTQDGGSIAMQRLMLEGGAYTLASGTLYAIGGTYVGGYANFNHNGGTNYGDITLTNYAATYRIYAGLAKGNLLTVGKVFELYGGLVDMQLVNWFSQSGGLHGGELHCGTFNVSGAADVGIGSFWPYPRGNPLAAGSLNIGGTATVTVDSCTIFVTNSIDVRGDSSSSNATLNLQNAIFSVSNLTMHENSMANFGGSGQISNSLSMYGGKFLLWNGTLDSPYIGVGPDATFTQSYGANSVHGVLSISGNYEFTGGKLLTDGIFLRGSLLLGPLSSYARTNVNTFTNTGLVDLGGYLGFGLTNGWGGQVRLSTNAVLDFIGSPAQLRFAASSAVAWTPGALMVISNWNNSGNVRLFFGNNASALTSSQLSQIQFSNPSGFAPGNYPAQMLSTGEVVPKVPLLTSSRSGNMLTLAWGPGWTLQSSTNIAGPYQDVPGAASPYAGSMDKPRQFFRLRQ